MKVTMLGFLTVAAAAFVSISGQAQTVTWLNAAAIGSGCAPGTTSVITAGDEISWSFSTFGVNPASGQGLQKNCRLTAGARIARGIYIATLERILTYGLVKTPQSVANISATGGFFNLNFPTMTRQHAVGTSYTGPNPLSLSRTDGVLVIAPGVPIPYPWCQNFNPTGVFKSNIQISALSSGGVANIAAEGFDVRFIARAGYLSCPEF
jgi:hypothetical protein